MKQNQVSIVGLKSGGLSPVQIHLLQIHSPRCSDVYETAIGMQNVQVVQSQHKHPACVSTAQGDLER